MRELGYRLCGGPLDGVGLMREVRDAMREGPKAVLRSASHLPRRHPGPFAGALGGLGLALLAFGVVDTRNEVRVLQPQVTEITQIVRAAAACQPPVSQKRLEKCVERIEVGLRTCRRSPSCREAFADVLTAPPRHKEVVPQKPSTTAPQQPAPGSSPGAKGKPKAPKRKAPRTAAPAPPPIIPAPVVPPAPPSPGNSGSTPAAENSNGVKACVEVAASACVKAELP